MGEPVLSVEGVEKTYAKVRAVGGVSFAVRPGEIFALLGPNGAGKTTLVRMLVGITRPDAGTVRYAVGGVSGPPAPADLGYLPEDRGLYKDVPVLRTLTYFGVLRGMTSAAARAAGEEWLDRLGLKDRARDKLETLSKGNQQKVQFAAAVLHRPRFAVLDEPFSGLDPLNQDAFLDLIRELRDGGMTVLLSAHQMALVERLADRVLLMNRGLAVLSGTLDEVRAGVAAGDRLAFRVAGTPDPAALAGHPAVAGVERDGDELVVRVRPGGRLGDLLRAAGERLDVVGVRSERPSLHDVYVQALRDRGETPAAAEAGA